MKIKSNVKRFTAALLALVMLAGCSVNTNTSTETTTAAAGGDAGETTAEETTTTPDPLADLTTTVGESIERGGEIGGPEAVVEGIQYDAQYQEDLNIDPEQFKGKELLVWGWWELGETDLETNAEFEALTGAKVVYSNITYETYPTQFVQAVTADNGPDIVYFGAEAVPAYIQRNLLLPVSDYLDVNATHMDLAESATAFYTINKKLYGLVDNGPVSSRMYFRKDIFANAGLENPYDYYKRGEWNWDNFIKLAQDVRQDTNNDGTYDVWGYYSYQQEQILFSNGGNYVVYDDAGLPKFGLTESAAIEAMEWERALTEQFNVLAPWQSDNDPVGWLVNGTIAMMYWGDWLLYGDEGLRAVLGDSLGLAPFPYGPSAETAEGADVPYGDAASTTSEGLAACSKNPDLAALYMLYKRLPLNAEEEATNEEESLAQNLIDFGSQEEYDMCLDMGRYAVVNPTLGFSGLDTVVTAIRQKTDMTVAAAIETFKNAGQTRIDETWNAGA
jgi:ABC-type glycerol-3-phosphate transport system substrate-binding protein